MITRLSTSGIERHPPNFGKWALCIEHHVKNFEEMEAKTGETVHKMSEPYAKYQNIIIKDGGMGILAKDTLERR